MGVCTNICKGIHGLGFRVFYVASCPYEAQKTDDPKLMVAAYTPKLVHGNHVQKMSQQDLSLQHSLGIQIAPCT